MECLLCGAPAVAVFHFNRGCVCSAEQDQALCPQHAFKANPIGTMELITDLTVDAEFTQVWMSRQFS